MFRDAVAHNVMIVVLSIVIQLPLGLAMALLLNRGMRGPGAAADGASSCRTCLAEVVAGVVWLLMLQPDGPSTACCEAVGLGGLSAALARPTRRSSLYTLLVVLTWKYLGFAIILFLAGLQGIPTRALEAARSTARRAWQTQRRITMPLLGPTIRIWVFLSMIGVAAAVRHGLDHDRRAARRTPSTTMATYLIDQRLRALRSSATAARSP